MDRLRVGDLLGAPAWQQISASSMLLSLAAIVPILLLLRWAALPKPIPGIPYNKDAARRIMGDIPDMNKAKGIRFWYCDQLARHNSPVVQVFNRPLRGPLVLVADPRETQDVLVRRTREFDKSSMTAESFSCLLGDSHISMKSSDRRYKHNRELLRDLMSPAFLNEVSAPEIHRKMTQLVDLWAIKTHKASGRPFAASDDLHEAALDAIMAAAFDVPQSDTSLAKQIAHSRDHRSAADDGDSAGEPFGFSRVAMDPELEAWVYLTRSFAVPFSSPLPYLSHWLYLQRPRSRRALRLRRLATERNIAQGIRRLEEAEEEDVPGGGGGGKKRKLRCAVDQILLREQARARKLGVRPDFYKGAIFDELFGYIVGGHDTVATTLAWWVKFMTRHQAIQTQLRAALRATHAAARSARRLPTAAEVAAARAPLLDAVVEETHRCARIVPGLVRQVAAGGARVLGRPLPRGTHVFFVTCAAGFAEPAFAVPEGERAETARLARGRCGAWDDGDVGEFAPRRWLRRVSSAGGGGKKQEEGGGEKGEEYEFDPRAGPQMAFGAGPRGCFGRKLAYLEMRIAVTLLLWSFEFLDLGRELNCFEAVDAFALQPANCFVRLRKLDL